MAGDFVLPGIELLVSLLVQLGEFAAGLGVAIAELIPNQAEPGLAGLLAVAVENPAGAAFGHRLVALPLHPALYPADCPRQFRDVARRDYGAVGQSQQFVDACVQADGVLGNGVARYGYGYGVGERDCDACRGPGDAHEFRLSWRQRPTQLEPDRGQALDVNAGEPAVDAQGRHRLGGRVR